MLAEFVVPGLFCDTDFYGAGHEAGGDDDADFLGVELGWEEGFGGAQGAKR